MAFIGNQPALSYTSFAVQHFTTSATTSYTLNYPVANENEIRLVINNVVQQPGSSYAYTASGTSLTLSAATTVSDTMYAVFLGKAVQTVNPPNGSVGLSQLSATGTKDSTTFLRGDNTFAAAQGKFESQLLHVRDEKAVNTQGGTATAGSFIKRDLNTSVTNEISGASISSSVITLPSGTYYIHASAPGYRVERHKTKLRNTSDSSDTIIGTSEYAIEDAGGYAQTRSFVIGRFTIASSKNFELQHRVQNSNGSSDFGLATNGGVVEVYADVQIWKVA
jgi:hypothetical protein